MCHGRVERGRVGGGGGGGGRSVRGARVPLMADRRSRRGLARGGGRGEGGAG